MSKTHHHPLLLVDADGPKKLNAHINTGSHKDQAYNPLVREIEAAHSSTLDFTARIKGTMHDVTVFSTMQSGGEFDATLQVVMVFAHPEEEMTAESKTFTLEQGEDKRVLKNRAGLWVSDMIDQWAAYRSAECAQAQSVYLESK